MDNLYHYPNQADLKLFIGVIKDKQYRIKKYLPSDTKEWYEVISDCINYVESTAHYDGCSSIHDASARLLYKIAKRHELGDGNKRSAVIVVYIFYILNNLGVINPKALKDMAKRIAMTKGRKNEDTLKKRISSKIATIVKPIHQFL